MSAAAAPDPFALNRLLLHSKLYRRDGLDGDRIEADKAAAELLPGPTRVSADLKLYRETAKGGAYAPRRVEVGDRIGDSEVLAVASVGVNGSRLLEVTCAGCGRPQLRVAASLNRKLRYGGTVECHACARERRGGRGMAVESMFRERAANGGPVYTDWETDRLCELVQEDLEAQFGEAEEPAEEMTMAAGWPPSAGETAATIERRRRLDADREQCGARASERQAARTRRRIGAPIAALLRAVDGVDSRAMLDAVNDAERAAARESRR